MTTLTEVGTTELAAERVTVLDTGVLRQLPPAPVTALSRVRGGMYSSTVDLIRFADGSTAHTDLIRLNPNIDAYSLDFAGLSPRRLAHYHEAPWRQAPEPTRRWRREIARLLSNSYPTVTTAELTRRLRASGYPIGAAEIRRHEAIAATQAAIWRLTNGLELDIQPLDVPVAVRARIGEHPSARPIEPREGLLDWHTPLPAGEIAYLELTLAEPRLLQSYNITVGARTGRHEIELRLEQSADGVRWSPVSRSGLAIGARRLTGRPVQRRLGATATLASAQASGLQRGHRHYRLAATGPVERDGLLDLRDIRLEVTGGQRFRNNERVAYLYDLLLSQATGSEPVLRPSSAHSGEVAGPFVLAGTAATVSAGPARVVDAEGNQLWGPIEPGTTFYLRHELAGDAVELQVRPHQAHARLLLGSSTPGGEAEFTPLVALAGQPTSVPRTVSVPTTTLETETNQEPFDVR